MKRLALAAAALVMAGPTWAAGGDVDKIIQLIVASQFVNNNCSDVHTDVDAVSGFLAASGVKSSDLKSKYRSKYDRMTREFLNNSRGITLETCTFIYEAYNKGVPDAHFFVKK